MALLADLSAVATPIVALGAIVMYAAASLARPLAAMVAIALIAVGGAEIYRARHCQRHPRRRQPKPERAAEEGFDRLCIFAGIVLLLLALVLPVLLAAFAGCLAAAGLLAGGTRRRRSRGPTGRVRHGAVRAGAMTLVVVGFSFSAFTGLGVALIVSDEPDGEPPEADGREHPRPWQTPGDQGGESVPSTDQPEPESSPYSVVCAGSPDAQLIGHGLGELFERDSAPKAGCGQEAFEVAATDARVARGLCEDKLRSLAVTGPNHPVMLYGGAAEFAWDRAQAGDLVGAEAAEPADGDVYLVETLQGTYGFARSSRSITPGREEIHRCEEATGLARPFVSLSPPLVLLWRNLLEYRAAWSWPVEAADGDQSSVAFVSHPFEELVADAACPTEFSCEMTVGEDLWPLEGSAFVSMEELQPFMP